MTASRPARRGRNDSSRTTPVRPAPPKTEPGGELPDNGDEATAETAGAS